MTLIRSRMQGDGSGLTQLTTATGDDNLPSWSRDGTKIGFTSERLYTNSGSDVFCMNADGTNQHKVDEKATSSSWAPDGRIGYGTYKVNNRFQVYVANEDGTGLVNLTMTSSRDNSPVWSPNGTQIASLSDRGGLSTVYTMNANGSNQLLVAPGLVASEHVWSPDGTQIAFTGTGAEGSDIYVVDANGANLDNLTETANIDERHPTWSPDSTRIIFSGDVVGPPVTVELFVIDSDGTGRTPLTSTPNTSELEPDWSSCVDQN